VNADTSLRTSSGRK